MSKAVLGMEGSGCDRRRLAVLGTGPWLEPLKPAWAPEVGGLYDPPHPTQEQNCSPGPTPFSYPTGQGILYIRKFLIT